MKKLIAIILCIALALSATACGEKSKLPESLTEIIDGIYANTEKTIERQATAEEELDGEKGAWWTGFSEKEFEDRFENSLKRQYQVTAIGQAIVVLEVKKGQNIKKIFDEMCEKANLNKFGCLPAQAGKILVSGKYITIIYGFLDSSDFDYSCGELATAFEKFAGVVDYSFDITKER